MYTKRIIAICSILCTGVFAAEAQLLPGPAKAPRSQKQIAARAVAPSQVKVMDADWNDSARQRVIPVKLYLPEPPRNTPSPILIFSHGLGGSRDAAEYLGRYLAQKGYICVHLQHPGSDTEVARNALRSGVGKVRSTLGTAATGENLVLRVDDVKFAIDELQRRNKSDAELKNKLDLSKVAVAGHSFGAGTALAICGQNYGRLAQGGSMMDPRVKAGIYLSAPVNLRGRSLEQVYGQVRVPGLLMTGTEDSSPIGETPASERRKPYDGIAAPHQYLVIFKGGDHSIFGGRSFRPVKPDDESFHNSINKVCGEFLDAYLLNDKTAQSWLDDGAAAKFLAVNAEFERK